MDLLVNRGEFEILGQPEGDFNEIIKKAATTCYQSESTTKKSPSEFVKMLLDLGHWSMFDHIHVTVKFKNCSRGFTHELVRHRIAAYAQESTRYVDESNLKLIGPPNHDLVHESYVLENPHLKSLIGQALSFKDMGEIIECFYRTLKYYGWKNEDARQLLPIGTKSEIVMTADFTEWRHVFALRTQKQAHWEIRYVMVNLLKEFKTRFAPIFDDFVSDGVDENNIEFFKIVRP